MAADEGAHPDWLLHLGGRRFAGVAVRARAGSFRSGRSVAARRPRLVERLGLLVMSAQFDVIVVGSGITGGWAAKELTEKGLKVLLIERGPMIEHRTDYKTEMLAPWELPFRGRGDAALYRSDYPIQSRARGF